MKDLCVVGLQWGDEGKGRFVDYLASEYDVICRFQGGNNAGHTVVNEFGEFKLHLIPSGVFYENKINYLGPGVLLNLDALSIELDDIEKKGITWVRDNFYISSLCTLSTVLNVLEDEFEEESRGENAFGSTRNGITPGYADRYLKRSIVLNDLSCEETFWEKINFMFSSKKEYIYKVYGKRIDLTAEQVGTSLLKSYDKVKHRVIAPQEFNKLISGKSVLYEAQLGALRDVSYGIFPYVSSSNVVASYCTTGSGMFDREQNRTTMGIMKAFSTCVGAGPFVTEIDELEAKGLREVSNEFGATTGRPRRIGHFDSVATRYGLYVQNPEVLCMTKLDCLSGREKLKVCVSYKLSDGKLTCDFPLGHALKNAQPVYEDFPGWEQNIQSIRKYGELPEEAKIYIRFIEDTLSKNIKYLSVGPSREDLIIIE